MPQQANQNKSEPNTQTMVLRVQTASTHEKLKKIAKCSTSTGTHHRYCADHVPVRTPSAAHVPRTNTVAWNATNTSTPTYLPASRLQRGTGLASNTEMEDGSRNVGKKAAVQ